LQPGFGAWIVPAGRPKKEFIMTPQAAMKRAIKLFGSEGRLAEAIGFTPTALSTSRRRIGRWSPEMAAAVEVATGGRVTRAQLRPDLFGSYEQLSKYERQRMRKRHTPVSRNHDH